MATLQNNDIVTLESRDNQMDVAEAIYGYAFSGNFDAMTILLKDYSHDKLVISQAIRGLARGNYLDQLKTIGNYRAYKAYIVLGLAEGGHFKLVASIVNRNIDLFSKLVQGYANGGHQKELLDLIEGTRFHGDATFHAAKAGHVQLVDAILKKLGIMEDTVLSVPSSQTEITMLAGLNRAVDGFCKGCHFEAVHQLLMKGANIQTALDSLKTNNQPNIVAYTALLVTASDDLYYIIFKAIQNECILSELTFSEKQIDKIKALNVEYNKKSTDLISFLTSYSDKTTSSNDFDKLENVNSL